MTNLSSEYLSNIESYLNNSCFIYPREPQQTLFDAMRYSLLAGGKRLRPIFVLDERLEPENGTFYLPYNYLTQYSKLAWHVFIANAECIPTILLGMPNEDITLPDTPGVTYTDGTNTYNPGDTVAYTGSNITLTAK